MDPATSLERPRKRRAINACANCRSAKVRCDGNRPCGRCEKNSTPCQFHDASKDEGTLRIERLESDVAALQVKINRVSGDQDTPPKPSETFISSDWNATERNVSCNAVENGTITWYEASFWFKSFFSGSHYLVPIFCLKTDNITSLSQRSSFLFDAIVSIGCRAEQGADSLTFRRLQSRVREHLANLLVNTNVPTLEEVQAITLMAAYSENGFLLIALALRFAIQIRLPYAVDQLLVQVSRKSAAVSEEERELYRLARVWHGICNLELFFSLDSGHLPYITPRTSSRKIRSLAHHPEHTSVDIRLLSQVELNMVRSEAYNIIAKHTGQVGPDNEALLQSDVQSLTVELSLWFEEWAVIIGTEPMPHQQSLALSNLQIQYEWALITLHLKAVSASGIENIAIMTDFQKQLVRKAKEAAERHLNHLVEASITPPLSPNQSASTYLNTFRWTMDYVWAKSAFSVLLVLKLAILLRDPVQTVLSLLHDAQKVLDLLKKVTMSHVAYLQILQTSVEKCKAALNEYMTQQDTLEANTAAETDFQGYVPPEFVFEWDFPGLNLKHMPLGWQDLFVDIDGLF